MKTLPLPEIISRLALATGEQQALAETFISEFTTLASEALASDGALTIKGLGSFRRIELAGEITVEFAPDPAMAAAVNAPFAMFEPVELDDSITAQMLAEAENTSAEIPENQDNGSSDPISAPADEAESSATPDSEPPMAKTVCPTEDEPVRPAGMPPIPPAADSHNPGPEEFQVQESDPLPAEAPADGIDTETQPLAPAEPAPVQTADLTPCPQQCETETYHRCEPDFDRSRIDSERRRHHGWVVALTALTALLAGFVAGYFVYERINLSNVKSVSISADDVQVYHRVSPDGDNGGLSADAVATTGETAATEVDDTISGEVTAQSSDNAETGPTKPVANAEVTDTVKPGRFLTTMALQHYGKKKFWVYIYEENRDRLDDPDRIAPNTVVVIPPAEKYGIKPGDARSEEDAQRRATAIVARYPK